ncbi:serine hydrolase [Burkholderia sp. PAMC 26561]|uniref:serine hydrolase n=1 Tax=Burkholderia sp. PAMC 26561 TaxID=1795043 RepID=UPI00076B6E88|nr:serine hydrolase [Burkholderia sp. PAMC 26561]AME28572.1 hypothetical protein AXG89_32780 [Burkholderia sp. PAMC 26561]
MLKTDASAQSQPSHFPSDEYVISILAERVDLREQSVGLVVGMIEGNKRRILSYGRHSVDDFRVPNGDSVFEIGSITKVYTSLLLADMVRKGEARLDEPVEDLLPSGVVVPQRNGQKITLQHLAMHLSGLPRMPDNFNSEGPDPFRNYTAEALYQFLASHELTRDIDTEHEYSNLGAGLLGHALACRAGRDYESLLRERVIIPLGLNSTSIAPSGSMGGRLVPGHDAEMKAVPGWNLGPSVLAGAGALRSTVNDQLTLIETIFGERKSNLDDAVQDTLIYRRRIADNDVVLGWGSQTVGNDQMFGHDGGTAGYRSMLLFFRRARVGVVLLSNAAAEVGDIAHHLLDPSKPLTKARLVVSIDPTILNSYAGRYELRSDFVITIVAREHHLVAQATGQSPFDLFPEDDQNFFARFDVQITFNLSADGVVHSMTLHQHRKDFELQKLG